MWFCGSKLYVMNNIRAGHILDRLKYDFRQKDELLQYKRAMARCTVI